MATSARTPMRFGGARSVLGSGSSAASSSAANARVRRHASSSSATATSSNVNANATANANSTTPRRATPKAKLNLNFSAASGSARTPLRVVSDNAPPAEADVSKVLVGVYAMVDVRLGADAEIDCSDAVARKLADMGAVILKKKGARLTHVVVSHFTPQWKDKVAKWHSTTTPIEVVSQLWVNACFTNRQRMKERAFFPVNKGYETAAVTPARASTGGALRVARSTAAASSRKKATPATPSRASTTPMSNFFSSTNCGSMSVAATPLSSKSGIVSSTPTPTLRATGGSARKRRALSMEPMASDAILKLLENSTKKLLKQSSESDVYSARATATLDSAASTPVKKSSGAAKTSTPPLTVRLRAAIERRKSIASSSGIANELSIARGEVAAGSSGDCLSESCSEGEGEEPKVKNSGEASSGKTSVVSSGSMPLSSSVSASAPSQTTLSLNIQSPGAPTKGEWACSICSCRNAKTRRLCKGCKASRVAAKTSVTDKTPAKRPLVRVETTTPRRRTLSAKSALSAISGTPGIQTPSSSASSARKTPVSSRKSAVSIKRPRLSSAADIERSSSVRSSNDLFADEKLGSSTPMPPAKKQKTTSTPAKPNGATKNLVPPRAVIGVTGVDSETRGVIECAVHGIDANMSSEPGYKKARVVKSVDYAAGVTHLIVGRDIKRTIKVLFAIARGAWIVSEPWVFSSLEQERWLNEEEFEVSAFPNRQSRLLPEQRLVFRSLKFFVGSKIDPSREVLISLIQCAGGEIVNQISVANYCICGDETLFRRATRTKIHGVTPKWVFDSIANLKLEDPIKYDHASAGRKDGGVEEA